MLRKIRKKLWPVILVEDLKTISQYNWERLNDETDPEKRVRWMLEDDKDKKRLIDPLIIEAKYCQLHDEYANATGGFYIIEKLLILMVKRIEARVKVGLGDKSQKNFVNLYSQMIKQLLNVDEEVDVVKTRLIVQKAYGQPINVREISAYDFAMITNIIKETAARTDSTGNGKS